MSRLQIRRLNGIADSYTPGVMTLDEVKLCVTLEPGLCRPKHPAIPAGTYKLGLRKVGAVYGWMSKGLLNRATSLEEKEIANSFIDNGVPVLENVPGREYIEIHIGNSEVDSKGCTMLGSSFGRNGTISQSTAAYYKAYPAILDYIQNDKDGTIDYLDFQKNA